MDNPTKLFRYGIGQEVDTITVTSSIFIKLLMKQWQLWFSNECPADKRTNMAYYTCKSVYYFPIDKKDLCFISSLIANY